MFCFNINSGFYENSLIIDSNGKVGIGTADPKSLLHLQIPYGQNDTLLRLKSDLAWDFKIGNFGSSDGQDLGVTTESSHNRMVIFNNLGSGGLKESIQITSRPVRMERSVEGSG